MVTRNTDDKEETHLHTLRPNNWLKQKPQYLVPRTLAYIGSNVCFCSFSIKIFKNPMMVNLFCYVEKDVKPGTLKLKTSHHKLDIFWWH